MIVPRVHRSVSWRHPYLVPAYAFVVSLLLATAVTGLSAQADVGTAVPPPVVAPPAPAAPIGEFREAINAIPTVVVVADEPLVDPLPVNLVVLMPSGKEPNSYVHDPKIPGKEITVGTYHKLEASVVSRLVCITARDKFSASAPAGMENLDAAKTIDPERTSCQGGWSEPLAVPAELTFFVERKTG
jgi:hypothetical protein